MLKTPAGRLDYRRPKASAGCRLSSPVFLLMARPVCDYVINAEALAYLRERALAAHVIACLAIVARFPRSLP
jgi:hypothetical protein